jgi:hypothetical protein
MNNFACIRRIGIDIPQSQLSLLNGAEQVLTRRIKAEIAQGIGRPIDVILPQADLL